MKLYSFLFFIIILSGCKKYLDAKQDQKLVIPTTIADMQALLDNYPRINNSSPSAGESFSDDYYLMDADYASLTIETSKRIYTWDNSNLFEGVPNNWSSCYQVIYYSNIALNGLRSIERNTANQLAYDNVMGQALFLRGYMFHQVALIWSKTYDGATASTDPGIPLRLDPDFNLPSVRGTVLKTYEQVISDLRESISLLPLTAVHVERPSRAAAYGMLARVYLSMRDYDKAGLYADTSLQLYNKLLDYNSLSTSATFPFTPFNIEVTFDNIMGVSGNLNNSRAKIDSLLYLQYAANDLRKSIFFKNNGNNTFSFKGSYEGTGSLFGGIATDEVYLIRAECYARSGNFQSAMNDLNTLLIKRWKTGTFIPLTATSKEDALVKILLERRKELIMRGLRWIDLKRLNKEGANINITRKLNGKTYFLPANDLRYAMPIPEDVIFLTGMEQNPK